MSDKFNLNKLALKSIGYVKLNKYVVDITFLEYFSEKLLSGNRKVYNFNFYHKNFLNISFMALYEILIYFNLEKITGTSFVTFWKVKKENLNYNKNSPFYILKQLQK